VTNERAHFLRGRVPTLVLLSAGFWLLVTALADGAARASLANISLSVQTSPPGGVIAFGAVEPGTPAVLPSAVALGVSSELPWRLTAQATGLPGSFTLEESPHGAAAWVAIGAAATGPSVLKEAQAPTGNGGSAPADFSEDLRLTVGWDLDPGVYTVTVNYQASFTDHSPPTPVSFTINGGATYANASTCSPVTLNVQATDDSGVVDAMCFTNSDPNGPSPAWSPWQDYAPTTGWNLDLSGSDGPRTVWAKFRDRAGNESGPISAGIVVDRTFPTISGLAVSGVTAGSADVVWHTDEAGSGWVEYGPSTSYGWSTAVETGSLTDHLAGLNGLAGGTTYHVRVHSADAAGNETVSGDLTFVTRCTPPTALTLAKQGPNSALAFSLSWSPSPGAAGYKVYRDIQTAAAPPLPDPTPPPFAFLASVSGTSFLDSSPTADANSIWRRQYYVTAVNSEGAESDRSGIVYAESNGVPPHVVAGPSASPGSDSCLVTWETDEPCTSQVLYGTSSSYYQFRTAVDTALVTSHAVQLTGLMPGTTYYFQVVSTDVTGLGLATPPPTTGTFVTTAGTGRNLWITRIWPNWQRVGFQWDAQPGATEYRIYRVDVTPPNPPAPELPAAPTPPPAPWTLQATTSGTSWTDGNLGPNSTWDYVWVVMAYVPNGQSVYTNEVALHKPAP